MSHEPKPRTDEEFAYLERLTVLVDEGRVFSPDGYEYKAIDTIHHRVSINLPSDHSVRRYHIVWWKAKGYWPTVMIDHEDRIPHHDWIDNLREASTELQLSNRGPYTPLSPVVLRVRNYGR